MLDTLNNSIDQRVVDSVNYFQSALGLSNGAACLAILTATLVAGIAGFYLFRFCLLKLTGRIAKQEKSVWVQTAYQCNVFHRISWLIPGLMFYAMVPLVTLTSFPFATQVAKVVTMMATIYMLLVINSFLFAILNTIEQRYRRFKFAKQYSIKSYLQVVKIILSCLMAIFVVAVILDESPKYLLTGLGAMTAVILLIFRDSILGFVASIQLTAYDMVRIGDWIEMPSFGADGDVIDISLNTIKIQNFDKTIVTIPSHAILSNGVKNWRGMSDSGGRRIKRSISVDVNHVKLCSKPLLESLAKLPLLKDKVQDYLDNTPRATDPAAAEMMQADRRCVTNLTLFRFYLESYLSQHPKIHKGMTFLIRELQDDGKGVPIEIYIFSNDTNWGNYEKIKAEIFDYVYSILPLFELKPYQALSGSSIALKLHKDDAVAAADSH